jgi:hypothetical protein
MQETAAPSQQQAVLLLEDWFDDLQGYAELSNAIMNPLLRSVILLRKCYMVAQCYTRKLSVYCSCYKY